MKISTEEEQELFLLIKSIFETDDPEIRCNFIATFIDKYESEICYTLSTDDRLQLKYLLLRCAENDDIFKVGIKAACTVHYLKQYEFKRFIEKLESLL